MVKGQQASESSSPSVDYRETVGQIHSGEGSESLRKIDTVEKLIRENQRLRDENKRLKSATPKVVTEPPLPGEAARRVFTSEGILPSLSSDVSLNELVYRLGFPDLNQDVGGDPFDMQPYHQVLDELSLEDTDEPTHQLFVHLSEHFQLLAPFIDGLIELVFAQLGWIFAPVRRSHIAQEHSLLWKSGLLQMNQLAHLLEKRAASLALYCGLLSVGLLYLKQEDLGFQVNPNGKLKESRVWFNFSLRLLEKSQFMSQEPNVNAMLTFCVLTCTFQTFGQAAYHDNLQAVMLRSALALRLHRLAQSSRDPSKWSPGEEDRRRIWAYLGCREGMFLAPGVRFGLQAFDTTECPRLLNVNAQDLDLFVPDFPPDKPLSDPTDVSFLIAQSRLAWLFNGYRGKLQHATSRIEAYNLTLEFDKKLQTLHEDQPYFALPTSVAFLKSQDAPSWLPAARHVFTLNILQKRLLLHRRFFALSLKDPAFAASREISTDTALAILTENRYFDFPFDDVLDTLHNTLTAAIVLIVDLLHPESQSGPAPRTFDPAQRLQEVEELLSSLKKHSCHSKQLSKAYTLLESLLVRYRRSSQLLPLKASFPVPWQQQDELFSPADIQQNLSGWPTSPGLNPSVHAGSTMSDDATMTWLASLQEWLQIP